MLIALQNELKRANLFGLLAMRECMNVWVCEHSVNNWIN